MRWTKTALLGLLLLLCACGSFKQPVMPGVVVEAPQVDLPEKDKDVTAWPERPYGYYRKLILEALTKP